MALSEYESQRSGMPWDAEKERAAAEQQRREDRARASSKLEDISALTSHPGWQRFIDEVKLKSQAAKVLSQHANEPIPLARAVATIAAWDSIAEWLPASIANLTNYLKGQ